MHGQIGRAGGIEVEVYLVRSRGSWECKAFGLQAIMCGDDQSIESVGSEGGGDEHSELIAGCGCAAIDRNCLNDTACLLVIADLHDLADVLTGRHIGEASALIHGRFGG